MSLSVVLRQARIFVRSVPLGYFHKPPSLGGGGQDYWPAADDRDHALDLRECGSSPKLKPP
jgi:hypothetical protein